MRSVIAKLSALTCSSLLFASYAAAGAQDVKAPDPAKPVDTSKSSAPRPGKDRWSIKTASDADAKKIQLRPVSSSVEKLLALPRPKEMPLDGSAAAFQEKRAAPVETSIFTVEADVVECRLMPDGDYRVVLRGATGKTLVLEMPDAQFVSPDSPFAYAIRSAREKFETKFHPEKTAKPILAHATITGIGFFGRAYGSKKPEGNLVQLHPVLDLKFLEKPTDEFTKSAADAEKTQEAKPGNTSKPDARKP